LSLNRRVRWLGCTAAARLSQFEQIRAASINELGQIPPDL
jgi:hypothetical protein